MRAIFILLIAMFSIQYGASLAKNLFPILGPAGATSIRISIAAIILFFIFRPWKIKLSRKEIFFLVGYGASLGFMNLTFYEALNYAPLGIVVALEFIGPLAVSFIYSRKITDVLWVLIAGFGIVLILPQANNADVRIEGVIFGLIAGFFWGTYIVFGKKIGANQSAGKIASLGMIIAALVSLPFGFKSAQLAFSDSNLLMIGLLVAIFSSALPYTLEMFSMKSIPARSFGILMSLEPVVAMIIGLVFLSEHLMSLQYLGIGCIIFASMGSTFTSVKSKNSL